MSWQEISDILTDEGKEKIKVGQVLIFDFEGAKVNLKIKRKRDGKVWAEETRLYEQNEMAEFNKERRRRSKK